MRLLLFLALSGLLAQTPPLASISGRLLAKASGAPISNAVVTFAGQLTRTDADGRFYFEQLPEGRWRLAVRKEGYLLAGLDGRPANQSVYGSEGGIYYRVEAGARIALDLYLLSGGTVSGVVLNDRGEPRLGARVTVLKRYYDAHGVQQLRGVTSESTNDRGEYRIFGLMPDTYLIRAGDVGGAVTSIDGLLPRYYPGVEVERVGAATSVVVNDGAEVRLNPMVVPSATPRKLQVHLVDETGAPVPSFALSARRAGTAYTVLTSRDGAFTLGSGRYEVGTTISSDMIDPKVSPVSRSATAAAAIVEMADKDRDFNLVIRRSVKVTGKVSEPIAGIQIRFVPLNWPILDLGAVSAADGTFTVPGLPPGQYNIDIPVRGRDVDGSYILESDNMSFPAGKCLASVRAGNRDLLRESLEVASQDIEIAVGLHDESTLVRGIARKANGDAASGAVVALVPDDRSRSADYFAMTTDQDGRFEFRCAQPGAFHLFAWPGLPGQAYRNAEFMRPYEGHGMPIAVEANASRAIDVPLLDMR